MYKLIFIFIYFLHSVYIYADVLEEHLTKDQMKEDFDFFVSKLKTVDPMLEVVRLGTGIDVLKDISNMRKSIDTVTCEQGFYDILLRSFLLVKDQHVCFTDYYPYKDKDTIHLNKTFTSMEKLFPVYQKYDFNINSIPLYYFNNKYLSSNIWNRDSVLVVPFGSEILEINGIKINDYIEKWILPINPVVRWDNKKQKYFVSTIFSPPRIALSDQFIIKYQYEGKEILNKIDSYYIKYPTNLGKSNPKVYYFNKDKILYIRIPSMQVSWLDSYKEDIFKYRDHNIEKIVIDIRDNGGGNDIVWEKILSYLIESPLVSNQKLAFKDNDLNKSYLKKNKVKFEMQNSLKKIVIGKDSLFYIQSKRRIEPDEKSLNYKGKIFVLINRGTYSSASAFSAFCQDIERLVVVGTNTGFLCGQGITPFTFMFPNSKLVFTIPCSLDMNLIQISPDKISYRDQVEVNVDIDANDLLRESLYQDYFYDEKYLYNQDPFFKVILDL